MDRTIHKETVMINEIQNTQNRGHNQPNTNAN